MKGKCDKFSAFAALDKAMGRDSNSPMSELEKAAIRDKIAVRKFRAKSVISDLNEDDVSVSCAVVPPGDPTGDHSPAFTPHKSSSNASEAANEVAVGATEITDF